MGTLIHDNREHKEDLLRSLSRFREHGDVGVTLKNMDSACSSIELLDLDEMGFRRAMRLLLSAGQADEAEMLVNSVEDFVPSKALQVVNKWGSYSLFVSVVWLLVLLALDVSSDVEVYYSIPAIALMVSLAVIVLLRAIFHTGVSSKEGGS